MADICCPLCGLSVNAAACMVDRSGVIYHQCVNCGLVFKDSKFVPDSQKSLERYNLHNNSYDDKKYVDYLDRYLSDGFMKYYKNGAAVLDYGCGPEPVLQRLLLEKYNINISVYDPNFFECDLSRYDFIISTEVFEHFKNVFSEIDRVISILNSGGILSIKTNFNNTDNFSNWWYKEDITHLSFYNEKTFEYITDRWNLEKVFSDGKSIIVYRKN